MRSKTSPVGKILLPAGEAGFTLLELLAVLTIVMLIVGSLAVAPRFGTGTADVKATAMLAANMLRETRALAINQGRPKAVLIDVGRRIITSGATSKPVKVSAGIQMTMTGAASERRSQSISGIRFFPNGSSTGGIFRFAQHGTAVEVRIAWLTGRVVLVPAR